MRRSVAWLVAAVVAAAWVPQGASAQGSSAQAARPRPLYDTTGTAWVYVSYSRVPWSRVDSLLKLQRYLPVFRARGIALGCFLDAQLLIHHTGGEYNVVAMYTYATFKSIGPGSGTGACNARAFREAVPDSAERAAYQAGQQWVFRDTNHYDEIYWVAYPSQR